MKKPLRTHIRLQSSGRLFQKIGAILASVEVEQMDEALTG
jgi:hypothetical protein